MTDTNICAFVDAQGFYINGKFVVRECAIVSEKLQLCQEFNPNFKWNDLSDADKSNVKYCTKYHGLTLNPKDLYLIPNSNKIEDYLKSFYTLLATDEKPYFAVKNDQFKQLLIDFNIPHCDLNKRNIPAIKQLERDFRTTWICSHHMLSRNRYFKCAYRKCLIIWKYFCYFSGESQYLKETTLKNETTSN